MDRRNQRRFSEHDTMAYEIERLLPRIPDEVTLDLIVPKLCWGDRQRLASVSRGWRHLVRGGGEMQQHVIARSNRFHLTETFVLLRYKPSEFSTALALYSIEENRCYKVPPFPYVDGGVPPAFQCVALDGKFYILGGEFLPGEAPGGDGVYMLDLANGLQWKRCASMIEPRVRFGCGVFGGKIYVFGGLGIKRPLCGSEVYDPKEDTWSPIKGMTRLRFDHQVVTVGTELIVHKGRSVDPTTWAWNSWGGYYSERPWRLSLYRINHRASSAFDNPLEFHLARIALRYVLKVGEEANFLELYNPVKDEWRMVEAIPKQGVDLSFTAKGNLHMICGNDIHVRDRETKSWTQPHSFSLRGLVDSKLVSARAALAVDDRLFTIVEGIDHYGKIKACQAFLVQSKDLGSSNKKIKWEKVPFTPIYLEEEDIGFTDYSLQPIQLQLDDL